MRLAKTAFLNPKREFEEQANLIDLNFQNIFSCLAGRVRFGSGTDGDSGENISGEWQLFTSSATPNAENTIAHSIHSVPKGYIILHQSKAGSLYQGPTTGTNWTAASTSAAGVETSGNVYLKCDVASVAFLIFLVT